jgi:hypothetical protein
MPSRTRVSLVPKTQQKGELRLLKSMGGVILLSAFFFFTKPVVEPPMLPQLSAELKQSTFQPGQHVDLRLCLKGQIPGYSLVDLEVKLNSANETYFVPASLRVTRGDLGNALVMPYDGRKNLELRDIVLPRDSLEIHLSLQAPENISGTINAGMTLEPRLFLDGEVFPLAEVVLEP